MTETHTRTWARTLSYRFLALAITAVWTGVSSAIEIHIALAILQYITERIWLKISWGKLKDSYSKTLFAHRERSS